MTEEPRGSLVFSATPEPTGTFKEWAGAMHTDDVLRLQRRIEAGQGGMTAEAGYFSTITDFRVSPRSTHDLFDVVIKGYT